MIIELISFSTNNFNICQSFSLFTSNKIFQQFLTVKTFKSTEIILISHKKIIYIQSTFHNPTQLDPSENYSGLPKKQNY